MLLVDDTLKQVLPLIFVFLVCFVEDLLNRYGLDDPRRSIYSTFRVCVGFIYGRKKAVQKAQK